jgi:penicillin-binding protein 1A
MSKKKKTASRTAGTAVRTVGSTIGGVFKVLGTILLIFILSALLFGCIFAYYVKSTITPNINISLDDFSVKQSSSILYEASPDNWQQLIELSGSEKRIWVDYNDIPQYMEQAVISIEDKRFYTHKGVDWYRSVGAFFNMFLGMRNDFGGSTITQQLIKNLTKQDDVTVQRKLLEIFQALELEKKYDKQDIMQWYLNVVYYGEGSYGVQAAAQTYFGKDIQDLDLAECAAIAGITNLPTYYDPFYSLANNKERQEIILHEMYKQGYITKEECDAAIAEELQFVRGEEYTYTQETYTYYEETVIADVIRDLMEEKGINEIAAKQLVYNGGYQIYCCMKPDIQQKVDSIYQNLDALPQSYSNPTGQQLQSGIVVMDPHTGEVVALEGGTGSKTINFGLNRAVDTKRPAGSSFKPVAIYGPATEYGIITPSTLVLDEPDQTLKGTSWFPANSGNSYYGVVTIAEALKRSLNTVSAQILDKLTPRASYDFLTQKLGFTSLIQADCDYAPLSLGQLTNGVTVREMAQAFSAFDNEGVFTYARTYTKVTDSNGNIVLDNTPNTIQAFSADTAHIMSYMLKGAVDGGTGSEARLGNMPVAGKTGTTTDSRDRWFVGYTPYYCAAVWTGYDTPAVMNFSGNPASQIWHSVMASISEGQEYQEFPEAELGSALNTFNVSYYYDDDDDDEPAPTATPAPAPVEDTDEEIVDGGSEDPSIADDEAA